MLIYLVRHGNADRRAATDQERELTEEGIAQNRSVVKKFFLQSPQLDKGLVSPYVRAQQTAADFKLAFPDLDFEVSNQVTPDSDPYELLNLIESYEDQNVIIVAHNPLLSNFISLVVDGVIDSGRHIGTSTVVCVMMDVVAPGCGEIKYALEP